MQRNSRNSISCVTAEANARYVTKTEIIKPQSQRFVAGVPRQNSRFDPIRFCYPPARPGDVRLVLRPRPPRTRSRSRLGPGASPPTPRRAVRGSRTRPASRRSNPSRRRPGPSAGGQIRVGRDPHSHDTEERERGGARAQVTVPEPKYARPTGPPSLPYPNPLYCRAKSATIWARGRDPAARWAGRLLSGIKSQLPQTGARPQEY